MCHELSGALALVTPLSPALQGRKLEAPQLTAPQHVDRDRPPDPLRIQKPDQVIHAGHRLAVKPHNDVERQETCRCRRPVRLCRR